MREELYPLAVKRAAVAVAAQQVKNHPHDEDARRRLEDLRRDYAASKIEDHIRKVVASAPPLTIQQRNKLALLLHGQDMENGRGQIRPFPMTPLQGSEPGEVS